MPASCKLTKEEIVKGAVQLINKKGYKIDKKCILIDTPIDSLGTHNVEIKLHKKVSFIVKIVFEK